MLTCEAVLTEVCFLLAETYPQAIHSVLGLLRKGAIKVPFQVELAQEQLATLLKKYEDVPMSLADGCLVCMSELYPNIPLLSLDNDFHIYRRFGNQEIPLFIR